MPKAKLLASSSDALGWWIVSNFRPSRRMLTDTASPRGPASHTRRLSLGCSSKRSVSRNRSPTVFGLAQWCGWKKMWRQRGSKKCEVCGQELPRNAFPASRWKDAGRAMRNWTLSCTPCHCWATCSQIKNVRAFAQKATDCIDCQRHTETWHCDACDKMLQRDMFNKDMLHNAKSHNCKAVCLACAARGFSPRDVTAYHCAKCGEQGHLKFARVVLANYKRRGRRAQLLCTECCRKFTTIELNLKDKKAHFPGQGW